MLAKLFIISICIYTIRCAPQYSIGEIKHKVDARRWLHKYGYTDTYREKIAMSKLADNIKQLQKWAYLPVTGNLDEATLAKMTEARCGLRDPAIKIETSKKKRYNHQGTSWWPLFDKTGKKALKWTLLNENNDGMSRETILKVMRQAFNYWEEVTDVDFEEVPKSKVDTSDEYKKDNIEILVSFVFRDHGDFYDFDGEGGTLAHAFYPLNNLKFSGDVHFDDDEFYTYQSEHGRNLLWIATHELGHSLGLEHSNVREAVMYPWYTKYKPGFKLHDDDVLGIQSLYGSRTSPKTTAATTTKSSTTTKAVVTTTTTTTTTPRPVKQCPKGGDITAIYYSSRYGQYFAYSVDHKLYLLGYQNSIPELSRFGYIRQSTVPDVINAILPLSKDTQAIFAGSKFYIFKDLSYQQASYSIHGDGPTHSQLNLKFPTSVKTVDAAITWYRNGRTYFFTGEEYWRYNNQGKRFDAGYPKPIRGNWKGLPGKVDAAFSSGDMKKTFFIIGKRYYLFDDSKIEVKDDYDIKEFLQCEGGSTSGSLAIGGISVGRKRNSKGKRKGSKGRRREGKGRRREGKP